MGNQYIVNMTAKLFTANQIKEIIDLYENTSASTRDIAKKFDCAYNTINRVLKQNNIVMNASSKMSAKSKGNNYKKGSKLSEESCKRISNALIGRKPTTLGKIYTKQERKNISEGVKRAFANKPTKRVEEARAIGVEKIQKARNRCKLLLRRVLNVTGNKKVTKTYDALGYTEKELIAHIEKQFKPGMSWEDRESFHIDHIKPVAAFMREGIFDPKIINALSNLQPLYPDENRKKSDKYKES